MSVIIYITLLLASFPNSLFSQNSSELNILLQELNLELKIDSNNRDVVYTRSIVNLNLKYFRAALKDLNLLLSREETYDLYYKRGIAYFELGAYDSSLFDFKKCKRFNSEEKTVLLYEAICYDKLNRTAEAINTYQKVINSDSKNIIPYFNLGLLYYMKLKEYQKSMRMFEQVLKIDNNCTDALVGIGRIYQLQDKYDRADFYYTKAIQIDSLKTNAYFNRASVRRKLGNLSDAKFDVERALKLEPENIDALIIKIEIFISLSQGYDGICDDVKKVIRLNTDQNELFSSFFKEKCQK